MRTALARIARVLLLTGFALVTLTASLVVHLQLPIARRIACSLLNQYVTGEIRGTLSVGRLDELTPFRIVARHVALYDADGRRIIVADRVVLIPDLAALSGAKIRFRNASLTSGTVHLIDDSHGEPTLFHAFDARHPSASTGNLPLQVVLHRVRLAKLTLYGELLGLSGMRATDVSARGRLTVGQTVLVEIAKARGKLVEPFGFVGQIDRLAGKISTDPQRGIDLKISARRDAEAANVHVDFHSLQPDTPQILDLSIDARDVTPDTLHQVGFDFIGPLQAPLSGHLHLRGPPSVLAIDADLTSAGGQVRVLGLISETHGTAVHIESTSLSAAKLVPDAPDVTMRGFADVLVPSRGAQPRLRLHVEALRYRGIAVPAFDVDGVVEDKGLRIERAHTRHAQASLSARGSIRWDGSLDLDVDASFPAIERDPNLSRYAAGTRGGLRGQLHVHLPATGHKRIYIDGRLELDHLSYGSIVASRVVLTGTAQGDPELPDLKLNVVGENVSVLAYALGNASFALEGGPRGYAAHGEFQARGQKTFYFNAKIAADKRGFVVQADPIELTVGQNTWRGLARDLAVVHGQSVSLGLFQLGSQSQRLQAQGVIRVHGQDTLSAQLQDFDLAALHALIGKDFPFAEGRADATIELRGDVERPELLVQGAMRGGRILEVDGVDALYLVTYKDGHLELDTEVDVQNGGVLQLRGQGEVDPDEPDPRAALEHGRYDLELSASDLDLTLVPALRGKILGGRLNASLHGTGTPDAPGVTGKLDVVNLHVPQLAALTLTSELDYHGSTLSGSTQLTDVHGPLANVHGKIDVDFRKLQAGPLALRAALASGPWQLSGETQARRLDTLPVTLPEGYGLPILLETHFDLSRDKGPIEGLIRFTAKGSAPMEYAPCKVRIAPELHGVMILQNGEARFTVSAELDGERFASGDGRIVLPLDAWLRGEPATTQSVMDLRATADIDAIERFPLLCDQGKGELHVQWSATSLLTDRPIGTLAVRASFFPRVRVSDGKRALAIDSCGQDPMQVDLDATADATGAQASGHMSGCHGGATRLAATIPLHWGGADTLPRVDDQRDLRVQLDFDDAELRPLLDRIPGVLSFTAAASGQMVVTANKARVDYRGELDVSRGKLYSIATGQQLHDISAKVIGNGNWAKLETLRATAGEGSLAAEGSIGFARYLPQKLSMALLLKNFPIEREGVELAWLEGSAVLVTEIGEEKAITAVKLHSLAIRLPTASTRTLQPLDPNPDVTLTTTQAKVHPDIPYAFEFFVDGRRQVTVRRSDFEAEVSTELAVSYQEPDLRVGGYIEFRHGTFEVFGKVFKINRGSMRFDGTGELNPEVNLVATHEAETAGGSPVAVSVTGTLAEPEVEFISDTCPGDGAVVLLVSGRCPTQDPSSATDARGAQDAFAAGIVGGILTLGAKHELGGLIPRVSVESTGQGAQARLKAGFEAVPKFMRSFVQRVYLQGAVSTRDQSLVDPAATGTSAILDFLIELYFPHNIVGAGRFAPETWGLDVTWEP